MVAKFDPFLDGRLKAGSGRGRLAGVIEGKQTTARCLACLRKPWELPSLIGNRGAQFQQAGTQ